jgi:hypothetical protein
MDLARIHHSLLGVPPTTVQAVLYANPQARGYGCPVDAERFIATMVQALALTYPTDGNQAHQHDVLLVVPAGHHEWAITSIRSIIAAILGRMVGRVEAARFIAACVGHIAMAASFPPAAPAQWVAHGYTRAGVPAWALPFLL